MGGNVGALPSALVARAREGDPEALEGVYRAYEAAVYTVARRICGNDADAYDVLQDTFLEVCGSIGTSRGDGSLWGWIRRVAVNKALAHLRREKLRVVSLLDRYGSLGGVGGGRIPEPTAPLELEAALDRLSPLARAVLWLHEVEGYTHREIGEMMGKTASFSKSQLSRAHQRLRELLG